MKFALTGRQPAFLALIQGVIGYEWMKGGIEKATDSGYIAGMTKTIGAFSGKNPNGWFASFLTGTVRPHAEGFGYVVMYGELLAGLGLALGALTLLFKTTRLVHLGGLAATALAAGGGVVMSFSFWQAAGWVSPSTDGLNVVMGLVQVVLGASAVTGLIAARSAAPVPARVQVTGRSITRLRHAVLHR